MPNAFQFAEQVAAAYKCTILIGVRAEGTWFATAQRLTEPNLEADGSHALDALKSVHQRLRREAESRLTVAHRQALTYQQMLTNDPLEPPDVNP